MARREVLLLFPPRLTIQLDENSALKAALETPVRKKEGDFKLYRETMGQVKGIFLQAIWQRKGEKGEAGSRESFGLQSREPAQASRHESKCSGGSAASCHSRSACRGG